jgi:hypothetical protein
MIDWNRSKNAREVSLPKEAYLAQLMRGLSSQVPTVGSRPVELDSKLSLILRNKILRLGMEKGIFLSEFDIKREEDSCTKTETYYIKDADEKF